MTGYRDLVCKVEHCTVGTKIEAECFIRPKELFTFGGRLLWHGFCLELDDRFAAPHSGTAA